MNLIKKGLATLIIPLVLPATLFAKTQETTLSATLGTKEYEISIKDKYTSLGDTEYSVIVRTKIDGHLRQVATLYAKVASHKEDTLEVGMTLVNQEGFRGSGLNGKMFELLIERVQKTTPSVRNISTSLLYDNFSQIEARLELFQRLVPNISLETAQKYALLSSHAYNIRARVGFSKIDKFIYDKNSEKVVLKVSSSDKPPAEYYEARLIAELFDREPRDHIVSDLTNSLFQALSGQKPRFWNVLLSSELFQSVLMENCIATTVTH